MSLSIFESDPVLHVLRERALVFKEHATTQFFRRYLERHIFFEQNWIHGNEVPPVDYHDQTRFDNAIQELAPEHGPTTLVFRLTGQAKHGKASPRDIATAEHQAYALSWAYLHHWKGRIPSVWTMTYYGPCARLWACRFDDKKSGGMLEPFYPLDDAAGERGLYRDVRDYEDDFKWAFDYIKATPQPDPSSFHEAYQEDYTGFNVQSRTPNAADSEHVYRTDYAAYDAESVAAAGPSRNEEAGTSLPQVVNARDYMYLEIIKITIENDEERTKGVNEQGQPIRFPLGYWHPAMIVLDDRSQMPGYIAHTINHGHRYFTWVLQPKEASQGKGKEKGKGKGKEKARG
ncbi:hypothetical protein HIM_10583 [Hirsutella minnesotensis 3608]|uniref:Uncharacterized protein n=1 Tax=Hirsutella minnesotensis 3608 TaxID=1043627 RepID=A0A0F7ZX35_9HYPO|nr:hypothetical protein HIM_10583 [Hirsutella minnesotensis 3608]